jgi:hypothetical protein
MHRVVPHLTPSAKHYSIENQPQRLLAQLLAPFDARNPEPALLESLGEQTEAGSIPV